MDESSAEIKEQREAIQVENAKRDKFKVFYDLTFRL